MADYNGNILDDKADIATISDVIQGSLILIPVVENYASIVNKNFDGYIVPYEIGTLQQMIYQGISDESKTTEKVVYRTSNAPRKAPLESSWTKTK